MRNLWKKCDYLYRLLYNKLKLAELATLVQNNETREISLKISQEVLQEKSMLDGCYVIKTDVPRSIADKQIIHDRYKDLAEVEKAFKISKSELKARPIYVRKKNRTVAHFMICMLAYKIERVLKNCWKNFDMTVMEILEMLKQMGSTVIETAKTKQIHITNPDIECSKILKAAGVIMPTILPYIRVDVNTRKKLVEQRK